MITSRVIAKPVKLLVSTFSAPSCRNRVVIFPFYKYLKNSINGYNTNTNQLLENNLGGIMQSRAVFSSESLTEEIDAATYENICDETLDSLCEFFEDIIEKSPLLKTADVSFGDGVLTVNLDKYGTYVINRQSPNKQIWLSSPTSGPKRYDFVKSRNGWIYRHDNQFLHNLLEKEISNITNLSIDLSGCAFSGHNK